MRVQPFFRRFYTAATLMILAALGVYLLGNNLVPLWDRDEGWYAQASRQMLESGNWLVPSYLDKMRLQKPDMIYWLQAGAMRLGGDTAFFARLPSAIAMALTGVLLLFALRHIVGVRRTLWATLILLTSMLAITCAKFATTDAVLLLFITAGQLGMFAILRGRHSITVVLGTGAALGLAILTKGPVAIGVHLTTLLAMAVLSLPVINRRRIDAAPPLRRRESRSRWPTIFLGIGVVVIAAAIVTPWVLAMQREIPDYLSLVLGREVVDRVRDPQEGHWGPPGYYLLAIWGIFFPWCLLLPATLVTAWRRRHQPFTRFALAAVIGPWIMFECVSTKLPHYLLPVLPFLAVLCADMLVRAQRRQIKDLLNRPFFAAVNLWWAAIVLLGMGSFGVLYLFDDQPSRAYAAGLMLAVYGIVWGGMVSRKFRRGKPTAAGKIMAGGMLGFIAILYFAYLPDADFLRVSPRIAKLMIDHWATKPGTAIMLDYKEPSLAFHQGGTLREQSDSRFLENTAEPWKWPEWIVITARLWDGRQKEDGTWIDKPTPDAIKQRFAEIGRAAGFNLAKGQQVEVILLHKRRDP